MFRRVASALIVAAALASSATAQTPTPPPAQDAAPAATPAPAPTPATTSVPGRERLYNPIPTDPAHPDYHEGAHRTIVRHNPLPRRTSYDSHYQGSSQPRSGYSTAGVGRYAEYYTPNTTAPQVDNHPAQLAGFGNGGIPDRNEQIAAQQAGQVRARNIQNDLNTFGTPYGAMGAGFGYGLGLGGGRLYTYPY